MSRELAALRYLAPDEYSCWRWGDDGDVVVFHSGGTLAFRKQLWAVLIAMVDRPLPPLELVLLVMAACRDSWPAERMALLAAESPRPKPSQAMPAHGWHSLLTALDRLQQFPRELRTSATAIATMLEIMVERDHRSDTTGGDVCPMLSRPQWTQHWTLPEPHRVPLGDLTRGYSALTRGLESLTPDAVRTRVETGLDQVSVIDRLRGQVQNLIEVKESQEVRTVRQLLTELKEEEEFRGLIATVRSLSAVLTLPRVPTQTVEIPQGGVSDIANRGPLDRLLLSELANDDDTLMTRVALNEALYIQREMPPAQPVRERAILIDAGIRLWGLPRLCAAAAALCLTMREPSAGGVRVFRTSIDGLQPVDFTTRQGLTDHLAALDCLAHPGELLTKWLAELTPPGSPHGRFASVERILITGDDVLADPEFRNHLHASGIAPAFVVAVNRSGRIRLISSTLLGEKLLKELWLDLDHLTRSETQPGKSLTNPAADSSFPAIFRLPELPLRLPCRPSELGTLVPLTRSGDELCDMLQITNDRRLLLWDVPKRGGRQVSDRFPQGQVRWSGFLNDESTLTIVVSKQEGDVALAQLAADPNADFNFRSTPLQIQTPADKGWHLIGVFADQGNLLFVLQQAVIAVSPTTGERLGTYELPPSTTWQYDRYFLCGSGAHVASFTGGQFHFDPVAAPGIEPESVLGVAGQPENRFFLLKTGELVHEKSLTSTLVLDAAKLKEPRIVAVSADGWRVVISTRQQNSSIPAFIELDIADAFGRLQTRNYTHTPRHNFRPLWLHKAKVLPTDQSLFRRPTQLAYGQALSIVTRKGQQRSLELSNKQPSIMLLRESTTNSGSHRTTEDFTEIPAPEGVGYQLKQVTWKDGSRAVLDSRGMLHLQSSDPSLVQLTLILHEKNVSGWCSTGEVWGSDYFINERASGVRKITAARAMEYIQQFLARLA